MSLKCSYCKQPGFEDQGFVSQTLFEIDEEGKKIPYWFCSMCCCEMMKHESGSKNVSRELYLKLKKRFFNKTK